MESEVRRTLLGPLPRENDSFPQAGEVRGALDMDLLNEEARLVLVVAAEEAPTPWVQAVLIDVAGHAATPYDLCVYGGLSDIPFPFIVETDVTGPLLVSQLGPCIGVLREDVTDGVRGVVRDGVRPVGLWNRFGSPWLVDDPRAAWKQREIDVMGQLSADAFRAVVEEDVVVFPDASAWEVIVRGVRSESSASRLNALIKLAELRNRNFTIPAWLADPMVELFESLRTHDERALLRPLMEQAMREPATEEPRDPVLQSLMGPEAWLADVSGRRPNARAFVRLGTQSGGPRRAHHVDRLGVKRRVQVSDQSVHELYEEAA